MEVETGLAPDAPAGTTLRSGVHTLAERHAAKAAELTAAGTPTSTDTVKRMRLRYRAEGLWGLVDQRLVRSSGPFGQVDARVVAALATAMQGETQRLTGTRGRLRPGGAAARGGTRRRGIANAAVDDVLPAGRRDGRRTAHLR